MSGPPEIAWDERGLLPAVVQDASSGAVLMVAWMNQEAFALTRATGLAHFWSRSRRALWKKGETSGNTLAVRELRLDCDGDTLLVRVVAAGPACHTGETSCFFRRLGAADDATLAPVEADEDAPARGAVLDRLEVILRARRDQGAAAQSYTRSLLDGGVPRILDKIAEEHRELAAELPAGPEAAVVHETADLLFHVMVGLLARDIPVAAVWRELDRRFGQSGHAEKAARPAKGPGP